MRSISRSDSSVSCPSYTSATTLAPRYSEYPTPDEQRLAINPRRGYDTQSRGSIMRQSNQLRVVFHDQESGGTVPTYGSNGVVVGDIHLIHSKEVLEVKVMLQGQIVLAVADGATSQDTVSSHMFTLWSEGEDTMCPAVLPFSIPFLTVYDHGRLPPPSYEATFPGVPGMYVKCAYNLFVNVRKRRKVSLLRKQTTLNIGLHYRPRTRPSLPMHARGTFMSTFKECPEEWHQVVSVMQTRAGSDFEPIICHLFIPSVRTYALGDTIPFHVQLTAPVSSLQALLFATPPSPTPESAGHLGLSPDYLHRLISPTAGGPARKKGSIRVFLYRQVTAEVRSMKAWRLSVLGEGSLRPLRTVISAASAQGRSGLGTLDWEGEVRCQDDVLVPGFNAGKLVVKDFVVLKTHPAGSSDFAPDRTSARLSHTIGHGSVFGVGWRLSQLGTRIS